MRQRRRRNCRQRQSAISSGHASAGYLARTGGRSAGCLATTISASTEPGVYHPAGTAKGARAACADSFASLTATSANRAGRTGRDD